MTGCGLRHEIIGLCIREEETMGREVRRVPAGWEHPKSQGPDEYEPLLDGSFREVFTEWHDKLHDWLDGGEEQARLHAKYGDYPATAEGFLRWNSVCPDPEDYRPDWPDDTRTHFQIYETVSEGTPISPVMADLESLARWYAENGDPVYGPISLEAARAFVAQGFAPSFIASALGLMSGVEYAALGDGSG